MDKAYKGEVSRLDRKSLTYTGAAARYYYTKKKILRRLGTVEKGRLEEELENIEDKIDLNLKISVLGTVAQIALATAGFIEKDYFTEALAGIITAQIPKMTNGSNGRKYIKRAYHVLERYLK